ncbi:uncharacterized protein DS421_3g88950 [Arachis hypogaea]|nr:uncharacterized protein DS421_3g88950 [Arachis hypogaea]
MAAPSGSFLPPPRDLLSSHISLLSDGGAPRNSMDDDDEDFDGEGFPVATMAATGAAPPTRVFSYSSLS